MGAFSNGLRFTTNVDSFELARLSLTELNRSVPVSVQAAIRAVADEYLQLAQVRALEEPSKGLDRNHLRETVSRGVRLKNIGSLGVRITTQMPVEDEAIIPRGFDSSRGWRHPVFGHKDRWVQQKGAFSWFLDTMQPMAPEALTAISKAIDAAVESVSFM